MGVGGLEVVLVKQQLWTFGLLESAWSGFHGRVRRVVGKHAPRAVL